MRIATYNVRDLFVAGDEGLGRGIPKPVVACKAVARVLDLMDAHVVALQEVGSQAALEMLNALLRQPYEHVHCVPGNSDRGIHLAYLSRHPLRLSSHRTLPLGTSPPLSELALQRDLLLARIAIGDAALTLANVHLKSKATPASAPPALLDADSLRAAELTLVLKVLGPQQDSTVPAVLLGDFNDLPSSDALNALRQSRWVDALQRDRWLMEGSGRLPGTFWPRRRARLDRILLNGAAAALLRPGSTQTHASTLAQRGSDHYPVSAVLSF
ncbi:MAG: endonuclease/exonuclease/phosphatase family protein [Pseudomonadota bacterium]